MIHLRVISGLVPGLLLLTGCTASSPPDPSSSEVAFPPALTGQETFLVDRYTNQLVVFDPSRGVVRTDDREQTFVYSFPTRDSDTMTVGSSSGGDFDIVTLADGEIRRLMTIADKGVFPLATNGTDEYFLINSYGQDNTLESTAVALLRDGRLEELPQIDENVAGGALLDGRLWFTVYDELSDTYQLKSVAPDEQDGTPVLAREGLQSGSLLTSQGELIVDGDFGLGSQGPDCDLYCFVDESADRLYALQTEDAGLALTAVDLSTGEQRRVAEGEIVDFEPTPAGLDVYLRHGIIAVPEGGLP